ncbi:MAG TPA: DUF3943 domain-containing protein [Puia sp.]|nr:DUF3943 domain-containing protein [Puia sp.]
MRPIQYFSFLATCLLAMHIRTNAQQPRQKFVPDTTVSSRSFGRAALVLSLGEAVPFLFDRYITRKDYAMISFQTLGHNLRPSSWAWDDDGFQTNEIGHPFHGSILFNAFRSNGYTFWQSVPAAFAGSYIWETFAENQAPSPNDFINTGFGGIVLGETTHRMAGKLVNNGSRGVRRQVNEILALLINPANGFSRIVSGKWGRPVLQTSEDPIRMAIEVQAGLRKYNVNNANPFKDGRFSMYGRIRLLYGTPYDYLTTPFSNLHITAEFGQDDSSKINIVSVYGSLAGWRLYSGRYRHAAVLSANYEYINNAAFFYSGQSIRMNLYSEFSLPGKVKVNTLAAAGPVLLAAVPDGYLYHDRNYDYGPGLAFHTSAGLNIAGRLYYGITWRGGWMFTVNGNASRYFLQALTNEVSLRLIDDLSVVMESGYFNLHGTYSHYNTLDKTYPYLRLSARWQFGLR